MGRCGVFLTHEDLKTCAGPSQMLAHPAGRVGLDHGMNSCVLDYALGQFRLRTTAEGLNEDEPGMEHGAFIICPQ